MPQPNTTRMRCPEEGCNFSTISVIALIDHTKKDHADKWFKSNE